jgi:glycosyltransferase involved in cell wall biosynthesis
MKLLVLSFYYPPDLSAGSFRTNHLVQAIQKVDRRCDVTVLTTAPNRYHSFRSQAPGRQNDDRLHVRRIDLPAHRGGFLSQSRAFAVYAARVLRLARHLEFDGVFSTSSRLMTAALGAYVARRGGVPLYLDIRDIFADTIGDVLPHPLSSMMKPMFEAIESYAIRSAASVNLVSEGFRPYFVQRYPEQRTTVFTNGIDPEFLEPLPPAGDCNSEQRKPIRIVYAGNMGDGQGLHAIIPDLAKRLAGEAVFEIIGDGGRRADLCRAVEAAGCSNVHIREPIARDQLRSAYAEADVLFLHLNDYEAFAKVLPSKIFEYAATGRPILAGVRGYAATFLRTEVPNAEIFNPCDAKGGGEALRRLKPGFTHRAKFLELYARESICRRMAVDILSVLKGEP